MYRNKTRPAGPRIPNGRWPEWRASVIPALLLILVAMVFAIGAGWTVRASARQIPAQTPSSHAKTAAPSSSDKKPAALSGPGVTPGESANSDKKVAQLDMVNWTHDEQTGIDTGSDFVYREGDTTITGTSARYDGKHKILDAQGNLVLDDPKHHVTGEKAHVDNGKAKLAVFTENVKIVVKPDAPAKPAGRMPGQDSTAKPADKPSGATQDPPAKPGDNNVRPAPDPPAKPAARNAGQAPDSAAKASDPRQDADPGSASSDAGKQETGGSEGDLSTARGQGAVITCDHVDDYYKRDFSVLRGHLVFKQHIMKKNGEAVDRTLTAEHAEYNGKTEKLLLFAPVDGHDSDGRDVHFPKDVTVGTREGSETLTSSSVHITTPIDDSDDSDEGSTDNSKTK